MEPFIPQFMVAAGALGTLTRLPFLTIYYHGKGESPYNKVLVYASCSILVFDILHYFGCCYVFINLKTYLVVNDNAYVGCCPQVYIFAFVYCIMFVLYTAVIILAIFTSAIKTRCILKKYFGANCNCD